MPRQRRSNRRVNRRGRSGRKGRRSNGFQTIQVPFLCSIDVSAAGTKAITAGDLGIDTTRPLRITAIQVRGTLITNEAGHSASVIALYSLIADGQEGTVSNPVIYTLNRVSSTRVRQIAIMDFGLYGTGGELCSISHTASTAATTAACILSLVGTATIQYLRRPTLRVVTLGDSAFSNALASSRTAGETSTLSPESERLESSWQTLE